MIYLFCESCSLCLRVSPGDPGEAESMFSEPCACPQCKVMMQVHTVVPTPTARALNVVDVNPQEAFAAVNGLGLPKEKDCSAAAVSQLLVEKRVVRVSASQIRGSHRCILEFLELEDGTRVYIGSSAYGATIYRVAPRHSYVEENDA